MFTEVKGLVKKAISALDFIIGGGLSLSDDWIPGSIERAKTLRQKVLKCSFELMKTKKILFDKQKGKISFEFKGGCQMGHLLQVHLLK